MKSKVPPNPVIFLKPSSAIIFSGESIIYPDFSQCVHHEIELGVVIGENTKKITNEDAEDHILGYCVGLDITARDLQMEAKKQGLPWTISKGFDTFAPISKIVEKNDVNNPHDIMLELRVNDEIRQRESTAHLAWKIPELISYISRIMTLERGDLILTGTPSGVSEIMKGDSIYASSDIPCELLVNVR
jgi:2-keto-4-pentenoate hydratase/2-oxohepta-3-ene-1,7-dioic acid hydratase in catechol pathway